MHSSTGTCFLGDNSQWPILLHISILSSFTSYFNVQQNKQLRIKAPTQMHPVRIRNKICSWQLQVSQYLLLEQHKVKKLSKPHTQPACPFFIVFICTFPSACIHWTVPFIFSPYCKQLFSYKILKEPLTCPIIIRIFSLLLKVIY